MKPNRKISPALLVALAALFVAFSGVAVAGTGDNFLLGRVNTAGKQTTLTGAAPNPQLLVQNTSTDGNARGVVGSISSPSAAAGSAGVVGSTASNDPGVGGRDRAEHGRRARFEGRRQSRSRTV
jgi:hypothetical protein